MPRQVMSLLPPVLRPVKLPRATPVAGPSIIRPPPTPAVPYPFSSSAIHQPSTFSSSSQNPSEIPLQLLRPKNGAHLISHLTNHLRTLHDPKSLCTTLFSRRHHSRLNTGSVLTVTSWTNMAKTGQSSFSGVLMRWRRGCGVDNSFTLRNVVNKLGVEMTFKVCSPLIKEVKVVQRADGARGGLRNLRRAKVNYLREDASLLQNIAGALKKDK